MTHRIFSYFEKIAEFYQYFLYEFAMTSANAKIGRFGTRPGKERDTSGLTSWQEGKTGTVKTPSGE